MQRTLPQETLEALRARVGFLRDLGIYDLYRHPVSAIAAALEGETPAAIDILESASAAVEAPTEAKASVAEVAAHLAAAELPSAEPAQPLTPPPASQTMAPAPPLSSSSIDPEEDAIARARKTVPTPPPTEFPKPPVAPADRPAALAIISAEIGDDCTRCPLGTAGRHSIVFGDGDPNARLLFVGEGPGADEDMQGIPFVGKAGQLLNNMITAMGLAREQVYIANIVKCRPPANRTPEPIEANTCSPFLFEQIGVIRPEVIVALGATASTYLMGAKSPLSALRGRIHPFLGSKLIVTYHPAYLLRDPRQKKEAWADLQIAMRELGLKAKA